MSQPVRQTGLVDSARSIFPGGAPWPPVFRAGAPRRSCTQPSRADDHQFAVTADAECAHEIEREDQGGKSQHDRECPSSITTVYGQTPSNLNRRNAFLTVLPGWHGCTLISNIHTLVAVFIPRTWKYSASSLEWMEKVSQENFKAPERLGALDDFSHSYRA